MKVKIDKSFNFEQRKVIDSYLELAKTKFDMMKINYIEIKNSGRLKTSAGNALVYRSRKSAIVKLNKRLFNSTAGIDEFKNTFSHELAHVIANIFYNSNCGHDSRWKMTHKMLGGNAKRTHNYDVSHLRPKTKKYTYTCGCQTFELSKIRHNKILKGAKYSCKNCKQKLFREVTSNSVIIEKFL